MNISIKQFNDLFRDINALYQDWRELPKGIKLIERKTITECSGRREDQGELGEEHIILDVGQEYFLRIIVNTDSYGDREWVGSMEWVKGVPKQVTVYEYFDDQC